MQRWPTRLRMKLKFSLALRKPGILLLAASLLAISHPTLLCSVVLCGSKLLNGLPSCLAPGRCFFEFPFDAAYSLK
jgi:hypothetical protein